MISKVLYELLPALIGQGLGEPFTEPGRVTFRRSAVVHEVPDLPHIVLSSETIRDVGYGQRSGKRMLGADVEAGTCILQDESQPRLILPVGVRLIHNGLRQAADWAKALMLLFNNAVIESTSDDGREFTFPITVVEPVGPGPLRPNLANLIEMAGRIEIEGVPLLLPVQTDVPLMTDMSTDFEFEEDSHG